MLSLCAIRQTQIRCVLSHELQSTILINLVSQSSLKYSRRISTDFFQLKFNWKLTSITISSGDGEKLCHKNVIALEIGKKDCANPINVIASKTRRIHYDSQFSTFGEFH
jgi:hypothetical protein